MSHNPSSVSRDIPHKQPDLATTEGRWHNKYSNRFSQVILLPQLRGMKTHNKFQ